MDITKIGKSIANIITIIPPKTIPVAMGLLSFVLNLSTSGLSEHANTKATKNNITTVVISENSFISNITISKNIIFFVVMLFFNTI
jgi:hypothetical protein